MRRWTSTGASPSRPGSTAARWRRPPGTSVQGLSDLDAIHAEIRAHAGCGFEVCETCTQLVPGEGSARARIVIVGEAPGAKEDALGRPFVGAAGRVLDGLLATIGLAREDVFIPNVLKARPPGNRDPHADEVEHHRPWLDAQLSAIAPALVVPLGRHALRRFAPEAKIAEVHGTRIEHDGRALFPLYHPAVALYARRRLPELEADMAFLGDAIGAPGAGG